METPSFVPSRKFKIIAGIVTGIIVLLIVFRAGIMVGYRKASFSYRWGDNYHRNFGGPRMGFTGGIPFERGFMEASGTFGQVIKVDAPTLVIKGVGEAEKIVVTDGKTAIKRLRDDIGLGDVRVDEFAVVIGEPDDQGRIVARLIRIMPPPPTGSGMMLFDDSRMPAPFQIRLP